MRRLKQFLKRFLHRPYGIKLGAQSTVMLPRWLLSREHIQIGARCFIGRFAIFNPVQDYGGVPQQGRIVIGNDVYIGGFAQIHSMYSLEIGDGSVLSEHVYVSDIAHGLNPMGGLIMDQPIESKGPVRVGRSVFVGFGASILPGVTLGDHCIVGTRAVVTRSFPAYSMVAGMPARLIKRFDVERQEWLPVSPSDGK